MRFSELVEIDPDVIKAKAFDGWMQKPETKLLISMVPPSPHSPELVQTLLESAFRDGFDSGAGIVAAKFISVITKEPKEG